MSHAYADEYDDELDYLRPTPSPMTPKERATRAVIYLRVSSAAQVNTDYDPEGISIPAQRVACERKARELGLTIVDEYIEPGRSGTEMSRRIAFQQMLSRVRQDKDVGQVIVYKLSRMARNRYDDAIVMADLRKRGITLISATEAVDDSPVGQLMHGILATFNEYQSRESGADISYKMGQKAKNGGTLGQARIGYLNVFDRLDGREIRTVVPDPERADLIRLAFDLYATGDYTLADLSDELYDRGLRTRQTPRREAKQVSINTLSTLLRDTYYLGRVTYKGEEYPGRHQPIVDEDVFEQVQAVIASRSAAGERRRIHHHYLKGSVYCGVCHKASLDRRLNVQVTTSKRGYQYWYFFCANTRDGGACASRHVNVERIERAVENHYATIRFDPQFITDVRAHIVETLTGEKTATRLLKQQLTKELHRLDVQEGNLIDLVSDASIPHAKVRQKLREIEREREHLKARLNETDNTLAQDARLIEACFSLLTDPHQLYRCCNDEQRRLLNQALFARLYVHEEEIVGHELNEPFATLRTIHDQYRRAGTSARPPNPVPATPSAQETNEAVPIGNGLCLVLLQGFNPGMDTAAVSNKPKRVEVRGFEPLASSMPWKRATNCAIPPHLPCCHLGNIEESNDHADRDANRQVAGSVLDVRRDVVARQPPAGHVVLQHRPAAVGDPSQPHRRRIVPAHHVCDPQPNGQTVSDNHHRLTGVSRPDVAQCGAQSLGAFCTRLTRGRAPEIPPGLHRGDNLGKLGVHLVDGAPRPVPHVHLGQALVHNDLEVGERSELDGRRVGAAQRRAVEGGRLECGQRRRGLACLPEAAPVHGDVGPALKPGGPVPVRLTVPPDHQTSSPGHCHHAGRSSSKVCETSAVVGSSCSSIRGQSFQRRSSEYFRRASAC